MDNDKDFLENNDDVFDAGQSPEDVPVENTDVEIIQPEQEHTEADQAGKDKKSSLRNFGEWVLALVISLAIVFCIKGFIMDFVVVEGDSMIPTLTTHDRLILTKLGYYPKVGDIIVLDSNYKNREKYIDNRKALNGGSISWLERLNIQYFPPKGMGTEAKYYVKRVIALPGDVIDINADTGKVTVNGNVLNEPYINGAFTPPYSTWSYPYTVEPDHIFVMGDNRGNSSDSRSPLGTVPISAVLGKAAFRVWPLNSFGIIYH